MDSKENNFPFKNDILQGMSLVNFSPKKVFLVNKEAKLIY